MIIGRHRFHGYGSLKNVYSHGKTVRGGLVSLRYARREASKPYRLAVVVSRKVSKSAVTRNRIRRRIYEAVRLQSATIPPGTDLIFTVFGDHLADMPAPKLGKLISDLLQKATNS
jgi:ribonuclease P protein component